jgi:hypothetical protein
LPRCDGVEFSVEGGAFGVGENGVDIFDTSRLRVDEGYREKQKKKPGFSADHIILEDFNL